MQNTDHAFRWNYRAGHPGTAIDIYVRRKSSPAGFPDGGNPGYRYRNSGAGGWGDSSPVCPHRTAYPNQRDFRFHPRGDHDHTDIIRNP